jgi:hypothetical protein
MDRKLPKDQEIQRLIRLSEVARSKLEDEALLLKQRLDVPARIRTSLKSHPLGWLFGSLASGVTATWLFRRQTTVVQKKNRGLASTLLGLALTAVQPVAKVWLANQLKAYLAGQSGRSHVSKSL